MTDTIELLSNGLMIHLKEVHTAPLISHWIWYRVGSRNEVAGKTGISHWVEHMQFKGTPQFPAGVLDKAISRDGGIWNAFTYLDWTTYYETLPADKIELALRLEKDRMLNSLFDPEEVESERTVVISELEGGRNEPLSRLNETIQAASFDRHPYRNEVIGELEDLRQIQRDDLYQHYRMNYVPNNAVVGIVGDFDTEQMMKLARRYYEDIPAGVLQTQVIPEEGPICGERRVVEEGPGETTFLQIAYRAPAANQDDFFALMLVDSLLTGPSNLNISGGGISNKTSRLYRALVLKSLAVAIHGSLQATIDPFLYEITATIHPAKKVEDVLTVIDQEIARLQDHKVPEDELARATKQARALFVYGSENVTNQGFWLGFSEMFASYDWFNTYINLLEKVTPDDVQRVAQTYLHNEKRVVGTYLPVNDQNHQTNHAMGDQS